MSKELLERYLQEVWNAHDISRLGRFLADDYVRHCYAMQPPMDEIRGINNIKKFIEKSFEIFPDWHQETVIVIEEDDLISRMSIATGTQKGQMEHFPALNRKFRLTIFEFFRIKDGKLAEGWVIWDNLNFLTQLGHLN